MVLATLYPHEQSVVIIGHLYTHPTIDFILLVLGLLLHHKQRMIK